MAETDADPATESELSLTDGCVRQSRRGLSLISEPHRMGILERYYSEGANAQPMPLDTLVLGAHTSVIIVKIRANSPCYRDRLLIGTSRVTVSESE
jgi:hypothetical protein